MQKHINTNKTPLKDACICLSYRYTYIALRGLYMYTTTHIFGDSDTEVNLHSYT